MTILDETAAVVERVSYTAYGKARHHDWRDVDGDGGYDADDLAIINSLATFTGTPISDPDYNVDADFNRDGVIDYTDKGMVPFGSIPALPAGEISNDEVRNIIGFAGYIFNDLLNLSGGGGTYLARHRWYDPDLGRWLQRDPAGYVDGISLYLYALSNPLGAIDPFGLSVIGDLLSNLCEGVKGFVIGTSDLNDNVASSESAKANLTERLDRAVAEGRMSREEADFHKQEMAESGEAVENARIDVDQARVDAVAVPVAIAGGPAGMAAAGLLEAGNATIDVAQGQYGEAALRGAGAAAGPVLGKGLQALKGAAKGGAGVVDDAAVAATGARARSLAAGRRGAVGEQTGQRILEAQGYKVTGQNVTFETPAGVRIRADRVGFTPNGQRFIMEAKNGPGARLTPNQAASYPRAGQRGWIPRGGRADQAGFPVGKDIGPVDFIYFRFGL